MLVRRLGWREVAANVAVAGGLALASYRVDPPWHAALLLPWALLLGGPGAYVLLRPRALEDPRAWVRVAARALPALGLVAMAADFWPLGFGALNAWRVAGLLVGGSLVLASLVLVAHAWLTDAPGRSTLVLSFLLAAGAALTGLASVLAAFFVAEAALLLAVLGFHRSPRAWALAAAMAAGVGLVGLLGIAAAWGSLVPLRVSLGGEAAPFVLATLAAALATGLAALWFAREPHATPP